MSDLEPNTYRHWRHEKDADGILWWCIDKADASANVLSGEVLRELESLLDGLGLEPEAKARLLDSILAPNAPWTTVLVTEDAEVAARCDRTVIIHERKLEVLS